MFKYRTFSHSINKVYLFRTGEPSEPLWGMH